MASEAPAETRPSLKRRAKFVIGAAVVVVVLLGLMVWAMARPGSTSYYLTTSELAAAGATTAGHQVKLNGRVVAGSIDRTGLRTTFVVSDGRTQVPVTTRQPLPSSFKNGSEIVAQGSFDGHAFAAGQVLAKCPSKFKPAA